MRITATAEDCVLRVLRLNRLAETLIIFIIYQVTVSGIREFETYQLAKAVRLQVLTATQM